MEALSHGIPVVAPDVGGISEIVNQTNGRLLSHNPSPKEIAEGIAHVLNSNNDMRLGAYNTWKSLVNAEKNYSAFARQLRALAPVHLA